MAEWVPESQLLKGGTISMKSAKKKAMFEQLIADEAGGAKSYKVLKPIEKALKQAGEIQKSHPGNLCAKYFTKEYAESLSEDDLRAFLKICKSGLNNPDSAMGCYAMQPSDYDKYKPFFSKVLAGYHGVPEDAKHVNNWDLNSLEEQPEDGKFSFMTLGLPPLSMRVRVGRNLADFPLPGAMFLEQRVEMEEKLTTAFDTLIANPDFGGAYHSLTPGHKNFINELQYRKLVKDHIMFKDMSKDSYLLEAGIASDWPYGRGCYVSEDQGAIVWVGEEDHLRIMAMKKGHVINVVFDRLKELLDVIEGIDGLSFASSPDYGMVTSCPTNLGTGMRASVLMQIPRLTSGGSDAKAKAICKPLGLSVRGMGGEHTPIGADGTCDISPSARFLITEAQIVQALYKGVEALKSEEDK